MNITAELCQAPPCRVGSTYCFTDVGVCVLISVTPIGTKGTPAQRHVFCSPGHWLLILTFDLDLCSQSQDVRAFFIGMGFSLILSKVQGGF